VTSHLHVSAEEKDCAMRLSPPPLCLSGIYGIAVVRDAM
jgi:hypothetical protein